jgi:uncharacterized protein involved in exopolysaccharide biosynthesis
MAPGASPRFYADLVTSRPLLDALLGLRPAETCGGGARRMLLERLDAGGRTPAESLFLARKALAARLEGDFDLRTGVVTASIEADCPALARELLDSVLAQLNTFNVERRQTRAKLRRVFAEEQVAGAESELRRAEADLAAFLSSNRAIESPALKIESDRLQRRVTMREELAATLRRDFEAARLEEINSTPALTVIEPPDLPARASFPRRRLLFALLAVLSLAIAAGTVLLRVALDQAPPDASPDFARLHQALRRLPGRRTASAG